MAVYQVAADDIADGALPGGLIFGSRAIGRMMGGPRAMTGPKRLSWVEESQQAMFIVMEMSWLCSVFFFLDGLTEPLAGPGSVLDPGFICTGLYRRPPGPGSVPGAGPGGRPLWCWGFCRPLAAAVWVFFA